MIQANELRIGNKVSTIDDKIVCTTVKGFYGYPINSGIINHNDAVNDFGYLKPIPITEEWLLKAGFEPRTEYGVKLKDFVDMSNIKYELLELKKSNFKFLFQTNFSKGTIPFFLGVNRMDSLPFNLEYVHQLQNLYFALTGEELEFKF